MSRSLQGNNKAKEVGNNIYLNLSLTRDLSLRVLIPEIVLKKNFFLIVWIVNYYHYNFFYLWINGESFGRFSNTEKIKYYFFHCKIQTFLEKKKKKINKSL